jgi:type IV fimbrial biogenesis protein FimT
MRITSTFPAGPALVRGPGLVRGLALVRGPGLVRGFTLLELMVTVSLAAIILGLGIPNLTQFIRNNRMTSAANDMLAAIHTARTEGVKRRAFTSFCFTDDPGAAAPTCANAGRGWIVFVDDVDPAATSANDANFVVDANEAVLLRHDALPAQFTSMNKTPANTRGIVFTQSGFARTTATPLTGVVLCDYRGNVAVNGPLNSAARAVVVAVTGRPQVNRSTTEVTTAGGC